MGETADQWVKKGSWAHGNRKSRDFEWETADQWEKKDRGRMGTGSHVILNGKPLASVKNGSWAQGGLKPLRKRGLKVQSPISGTWVTGKQHKMNKLRFIGLFTITVVSFEFLFDKCSLMFITIDDLVGVFTGIHRGRS